MKRLLGRLLSKSNPLGEVAEGDWSLPAPEADRDWAAWLSDDSATGRTPSPVMVRAPQVATTPSGSRIRGPDHPPAAFAEQGPLQRLTSEELVVVPPQQTHRPEAGANPSWDSVLCAYAEHLTDEEIMVLRDQLSPRTAV